MSLGTGGRSLDTWKNFLSARAIRYSRDIVEYPLLKICKNKKVSFKCTILKEVQSCLVIRKNKHSGLKILSSHGITVYHLCLLLRTSRYFIKSHLSSSPHCVCFHHFFSEDEKTKAPNWEMTSFRERQGKGT